MSKKPQVAIIMGSDSDLLVISEAAKILDQFKITGTSRPDKQLENLLTH